ncbi:glycoside hydrolase superfamily [Bisporella sp. PMI_857]|nr:glycoside hydrolase superfamily [Bisporella sp. PMI_857]
MKMQISQGVLAMLLSPTLAAVAGPQLVARQAATTLTINPAQTYQTIDGFGFSQAFQRANLVVNLGAEKQKYVLDLLFNTTTGAGFSILRNGIGSSPNSNNDWMNTILPTNPGSPSATPRYVWDGKDSGQLFMAKQAVAYGVKTIYADAWSAPGFMKTNGNDAGGGYLCGLTGHSCSSGDWRQAYANYLVQYIRFYQQEGVNVTHIGHLNEPDLSTSYASMLSNGNEAGEFTKILAATIKAQNLSVIVGCCESTGWSVTNQVASQLRSSGAISSLGFLTGHEYTSRATSPINSGGLKVWETEYSDLNGGWSTAWYSNGGAGDGLTWANNIYNGLVSANCSAYLYWVGTQDRATNNNNNEKLILVDGQTVTVSKRLWAFAQYSRFVRPGAIRIGSTNSGNLKSSAFKNLDGSIAVQVINSGTGAATVNLKGLTGTKVTSWLTDNTHDLDSIAATIAADGTVTGSVAARALVSFVVTT